MTTSSPRFPSPLTDSSRVASASLASAASPHVATTGSSSSSKAELAVPTATATSTSQRHEHASRRSSSAASASVDHIPHDVRLKFHWEGYLQKRSDWLKHWETYYFVLKGRALYCYLSEEDARQQPEKSKIKKGKFGFADRVTLVRVWDVEETAPTAAPASSPPVSQSARDGVSLFRFTLETEKGHQLHFRTNSDATKHVWLQYAAHAIADYDASGAVRPQTKRLRTNVQDFYCAYEYLYAALCSHVDCELYDAAQQQQSAASVAAAVERLSLNGAGGSSSSSSSSSSSKKIQSTLTAVAPDQPMRKASVAPALDHTLLRFFSLLSPDVILRSNYLPMVPFAGKYRGFSGVLDFFTRVSQSVRFEHFSLEKVDIEDDESPSSRRSRVLVVSGRETMQVRFNQTTFMQQWTHKLHFKPSAGGLVSRWEIFGDVVASSVVFKAPGFTTNLTLPSLSERIRESFVGGHVVTIQLQHIADVRSRELARDVRTCPLCVPHNISSCTVICDCHYVAICNTYEQTNGLSHFIHRASLCAARSTRTSSRACGTQRRSRKPRRRSKCGRTRLRRLDRRTQATKASRRSCTCTTRSCSCSSTASRATTTRYCSSSSAARRTVKLSRARTSTWRAS